MCSVKRFIRSRVATGDPRVKAVQLYLAVARVYNRVTLTRSLPLPLYVDQRELPLLQLRYVGPYSDDELYALLRQMEVVLTLPGKKVGIVDLTHADAGTAKQRRMHAEWIGGHKQALAHAFSAAVIVTDNALIRGTVTAVFWVAPLPLPTHVAPTVERAQAWLAPFLETIQKA